MHVIQWSICLHDGTKGLESQNQATSYEAIRVWPPSPTGPYRCNSMSSGRSLATATMGIRLKIYLQSYYSFILVSIMIPFTYNQWIMIRFQYYSFIFIENGHDNPIFDDGHCAPVFPPNCVCQTYSSRMYLSYSKYLPITALHLHVFS